MSCFCSRAKVLASNFSGNKNIVKIFILVAGARARSFIEEDQNNERKPYLHLSHLLS